MRTTYRQQDALTILPLTTYDLPNHARLAAIIDGIGSVVFWTSLIDFLEEVVGGEHCVVWKLSAGCMQQVGAASWDGADQAQQRLLQYSDPTFWRRDPALIAARRKGKPDESLALLMDPRRVSDTLIRDTLYGQDQICERVVLCKTHSNATFGLSIVRGEDRGPFSSEQLNTLSGIAETLLSITSKHRQITAHRNAFNPVGDDCLPDIERALQHAADTRLSLRESQVCARLICGRTLPSIADELGVGTETVETYRKRAYVRLGISSKHELLLQYLGYH